MTTDFEYRINNTTHVFIRCQSAALANRLLCAATNIPTIEGVVSFDGHIVGVPRRMRIFDILMEANKDSKDILSFQLIDGFLYCYTTDVPF